MHALAEEGLCVQLQQTTVNSTLGGAGVRPPSHVAATTTTSSRTLKPRRALTEDVYLRPPAE